MPTKSNIALFESGDVDKLVGGGLAEELRSADLRIFNLETPLADRWNPIDKCGPNLIASTRSVKGIKALGADFMTLANNHIMDQGRQGLESTLDVLATHGIAFAGAGKTPEEAARPFVFVADGIKVGVYCCAEHEFSIVSGHNAGANPFDPLESPDHVASLKKECDYVIVLYHGGKEYYRYPSPRLQKTCRKLADKGADLIVCQHSHCIGCEETYHGSAIVYGQGNFIFDGFDGNDFTATSLLLRVSIGDKAGVEHIPIARQGCGVLRAEGPQKEKIMSDFLLRSEAIKGGTFVADEYKKFANSMLDKYLIMARGVAHNFIFRAVNKLSGHKFARIYVRRKYKKADRLALRNIIECEAHSELFLAGLNG